MDHAVGHGLAALGPRSKLAEEGSDLPASPTPHSAPPPPNTYGERADIHVPPSLGSASHRSSVSCHPLENQVVRSASSSGTVLEPVNTTRHTPPTSTLTIPSQGGCLYACQLDCSKTVRAPRTTRLRRSISLLRTSRDCWARVYAHSRVCTLTSAALARPLPPIHQLSITGMQEGRTSHRRRS